MTWDTVTNSESFKAIAALIGGGFGVGYIRERRKTKKDAYGFAMDLIAQQNLRLDELTKDMGRLEGKIATQANALAVLQRENEELKVENARLKTALGEHR